MAANECMTPPPRISFLLPRTLRRSTAWRQFGRARPGGAAATHAGKSLPPLALSLPRRLGDACVRHVPGAQVRLWCGST
jgi:hypothetical protein